MENVLDVEIGLENQLTEEVTALWTEHVRVSGAKKATTAELRRLRATLAQKLYNMKQVLSRVGRGGQWRGWLGEVKIPRSTADRLVERHAELLGVATENVLTGAISTTEEVKRLIKATVPRLRRVLSTPQLAYQYVVSVAEEFGLTCTTLEGGILLTQPASEEKPTSEPERFVDGDGTGENFDDVPSDPVFSTPQVTLSGKMA